MSLATSQSSAPRLALDERPTTVNTILALWAGLVAGLIVALGGFDDPRLWHNAWVRLMTLGVTTVALGWALQTSRAMLARRLQLGVAGSLVLHTLLVVGLAQMDLSLSEDVVAKQNPEPDVTNETPKAPELVVIDRQQADQRPEFERPLASGSPQMKSDDQTLDRSAPGVAQRDLAEVQPPEQSLQPSPMQLDLPRPRAPVVQRGDTLGMLSLQPTPPPEIDLAAITMPAIQPAETESASSTPNSPTPLPRAMRTTLATQPKPLELPAEIDEPLPSLLPPRRERDTPRLAQARDWQRPPTRRPVQLPSSSALASERAPVAPQTTQQPAIAAPPRPAPLALARASGGFAGLERSRNAGLELPASPNFPMTRDAGAATRVRATQTDRGENPTPSARPETPQSRASANQPRSTLKSNATSAAEVAGLPTPSDRNATSSAANAEAFSQDTQRDLTAAAGQQAIDRRQPAIVPERGLRRGGAGGAPQLSLAPSRRPPLPASRQALAASAMATAALPMDTTPAASPLANPTAARTNPTNATPAVDMPRAPLDLLAGGGPRQPRRRRGPLLSIAPEVAGSASAAAGSPGPAGNAPRLAMRGSARGSDAVIRSQPAVRITAPVGAGGLASVGRKSLGLPDELLPSSDWLEKNSGDARGLRRGGSPSMAGAQRQPTAAFDDRGRRREQQPSGGQGQPAPKTDAAIERGLAFLAKLQLSDGRWSYSSLGDLEAPKEEIPNVQADAAATGMVLLSFLGAGYDHYGGEHSRAIERGLAYLVSVQKASGELFPEDSDQPGGPAAAWQVARFYSHGIATIALCEAYGMTGDDELREPAQRALDYIREKQDKRLGGWRYTPGVSSDLSVTGWQLMALKSGELAGLKVDQETYAGVKRFVEQCRERSGNQARFCYNPDAPRSDPKRRHGRRPGTVMTSVGLLASLYLGEKPEDERVRLGADHLLEHLPTIGDGRTLARTSTLGNPLRDTYYWYYATQVMYHIQGEHWQAWRDALRPLLVESQTLEGPLTGSWNPRQPVPDKWAPFGGRLYVTAMNLLSLEVQYRHLPLYGGKSEAANPGNE